MQGRLARLHRYFEAFTARDPGARCRADSPAAQTALAGPRATHGAGRPRSRSGEPNDRRRNGGIQAVEGLILARYMMCVQVDFPQDTRPRPTLTSIFAGGTRTSGRQSTMALPELMGERVNTRQHHRRVTRPPIFHRRENWVGSMRWCFHKLNRSGATSIMQTTPGTISTSRQTSEWRRWIAELTPRPFLCRNGHRSCGRWRR
jgi:hypothetical protein